MTAKHRLSLISLVLMTLAACGGPTPSTTAPPSPTEHSGGLTHLDQTATAEAGASHHALTDLDKTATAHTGGHGHTEEHATSTPLPPAALTPSATVAVQVDGGTRYQTISGFGATFRPFDSPFSKLDDPTGPDFTTATDDQRRGIADILFRQLGLTRFRVFPTDYEKANDNGDPFTLNPAGFDWTIADQEVAFIALTKPMGLQTPWASFSVDGGENTAWLRQPGSPCALNPALVDEDVEWLYAAAKHFRDAGQELPYVTINNEPDLCPPGYKLEIADYVTILKRLGARLRQDGINSQIVVSDGWIPQNALLYMQAALADADARQYVGALAYHAYADSYDDPANLLENSAQSRPPHTAVEVREKIRDLAAQNNLPVWMTEVCYCLPRPGFSEFELLRARLNHLHDELTLANVSAFDAINLYNIRRPGVSDELVEVFYRPDGSMESYQLATYGQLFGQYSRFVLPDSVRVKADSSDARLRVVAFVRPDNKPVVVLLNNNPFAVQVGLSLAGLSQTPTAFSVLASREGSLWETPPDVPVSNGSATLVALPLSVTTVVGK